MIAAAIAANAAGETSRLPQVSQVSTSRATLARLVARGSSRSVFRCKRARAMRRAERGPTPGRRPNRAIRSNHQFRRSSKGLMFGKGVPSALAIRQMIGQHAGRHGRGDGDGADAHDGSCRPFVTTSTSRPKRSKDWRGVRIEEVGLTAKRATKSWPEEIPPKTPPAWLAKNWGLPSGPRRISSAFPAA